jgi:hypothetical protein
MARTGRVNHTHQYFRHTDGLWYCSGIEGCSHYVPKNNPPPVGRKSRCWTCGNEFQLLPMNMKEDKPNCDACVEELESIETFLEMKGVKKSEDPFEKMSRIARENSAKKMKEDEMKMKKKDVIEDEIEVFEPNSEHALDCEIHVGGDCTCGRT